jgi:para-nitrobenzyl esterase
MVMISPLATGLFSKAIAESGGDMGPSRTSEGIAVLEDAEKTGAAFVTTLGANTVAELRRMSAEKIVATQFKGLAGIPHSDGSLPVQDGYVIPGDTYELYAAGKQAKIPLLIGYTDDEAVNLIQPVDAEKYAANVRAQYGDLADEFLRPPGRVQIHCILD